MKDKDKKVSIGTILGIIFIAIGLMLFFYPDVKTYYSKRVTESYIKEFHQEIKGEKDKPKEDMAPAKDSESKAGTEKPEEAEEDYIPKDGDPLYEEILSYNINLYESGQQGFSDAWTITQVPVELKNLKDDTFGYIEIPAMDVTLPLYIGANNKNMAKGAAILGQTSIPIGGENTNAVIAGHRGFKGIPFFREIEMLKEGDAIFITNRWEKLIYRVSEIMIIDPYESDKLSIRDGQDMISLVTCHPYRSHGKKRYIVFATRDTSQAEEEEISAAEDNSGTDKVTEKVTEIEDVPEEEEFESSAEDIEKEDALRRVGAVMIFMLIVLTYYRERRG